MSLIERAVDRMSDGAEPARPASGIPATPAPSPPRSTIEEGIERLAQHTPQEPEALAAAAPAAAPVPETAPAAAGATAAAPVHVDTRPQVALGPLRQRGFVSPDGEKSRLAQEFRVIKRPVIDNAFGKGVAPVRHGKRVMVTSAFPSEGKSFCAINLALSIAAERDHSVLLVDADVARPSIPRVLGFNAGAGLMDWLIDGNLDVTDLVVSTDVEKLDILPAGQRHDNATEFLASGSMHRLLDQISERFPDRIVIFDSPPLLLTTESRVLASYMGQIIVVVEASKTSRSAVEEALATIEGTAEVIGMVLNKTQSEGTGGYGNYGGYYGYGYGQGYGKISSR